MGDKPKGGTKDAKAAGGKPATKGTTPIDDVNVPKNIDIEYEDIKEESNYIIMEKSFQAKQIVAETKPKTTARSSM